MLTLLLAHLLLADPQPDAGLEVACTTVDDCWLDERGNAIPRPKKFKKRAPPRGDCGKNKLWLRHELTCTENRCVSRFRGDRC
jgi:hypothetical protein